MKLYAKISLLIFIFILALPKLVYSEETIEAYLDGKILVVRNDNVEVNCCAKFSDKIEIKDKTIRITQTDTSSVKCRCMCNIDMYHYVAALQTGKYKIELYRDELKVYGYPEDRRILVGTTEFEIKSPINKTNSYFEFKQSPCKTNSKSELPKISKYNDLSIFPNPSQGVINIKFNSLPNQEVRFVLYNFIGKEVYSKEFDITQEGSYSYKLDLSNLPEGVYIGKTISRNGHSSAVKLIWSK